MTVQVQPFFDRLRKCVQLLLPDRSLKLFPPDFTLRRPVRALLERALRREGRCYLVLFRVGPAQAGYELPRVFRDMLGREARNWLKAAAPARLAEADLIAADQYGQADFVLLVRVTEEEGDDWIPPRLRQRLDELRASLERDLGCTARPVGMPDVQVTGAYVPLRGDASAAEELLHEAYQLALAIATGQLSPHLSQIRKQMDAILRDGSITVLAQPIMNLSTGDVYGWEMLCRGPASTVFHLPDELFRYAAQTNVLCELEFLVVRRALEEIAARRVREPVFLNVTAVTLSHPDFLSHTLECLAAHPGLTPGQIVFEITERHNIPDIRALADILKRFRAFGFRFAVDDAGSGYSSLQWIGELVPELIKIDRSVIRDVDREAVKEALLRALVSVAREMRCEVVAEGVEREEEADVLFRLNVGMGQGYYFARPGTLLHEHERVVFQETKERIQVRRNRVAS